MYVGATKHLISAGSVSAPDERVRTRRLQPELVYAIEPYIAHLKLKPELLRVLADKRVIAQGLSSDHDKEMATRFSIVMADATPDACVEP